MKSRHKTAVIPDFVNTIPLPSVFWMAPAKEDVCFAVSTVGRFREIRGDAPTVSHSWYSTMCLLTASSILSEARRSPKR